MMRIDIRKVGQKEVPQRSGQLLHFGACESVGQGVFTKFVGITYKMFSDPLFDSPTTDLVAMGVGQGHVGEDELTSPGVFRAIPVLIDHVPKVPRVVQVVLFAGICIEVDKPRAQRGIPM